MNPIFAIGRARPPRVRAVLWLILASLLLIQAKVAFGACLLTGAAAQASITQPAGSVSTDLCADNSSPATLTCPTHCEQASESPKPNADTGQLLLFALPAGPAPLAPIDSSPFVVHESPVAWADQSLYLRLHRLLN